MNNLHVAYIAGLLDGEGSITVSQSFCKARTRRYELQVSIVNTWLEPLLAVKAQHGGSIHSRKNFRFKPVYHWSVGQRAGECFLRKVLPYLIIKKQRALLALDFMEKKHGKPGQKLDKAELELRKSYYEQMKKLNS